jgi:DNA-binding NarL/FixJ family response regulator
VEASWRATVPQEDVSVFLSLGYRRVQLLRCLADGLTEREAAERLGVKLTSVRSQVEDIKDVTGCESVRELGRWWRSSRSDWLAFCERLGGAG